MRRESQVSSFGRSVCGRPARGGRIPDRLVGAVPVAGVGPAEPLAGEGAGWCYSSQPRRTRSWISRTLPVTVRILGFAVVACVAVGIAVGALLLVHARSHHTPTVAGSHQFVVVPANASRTALVAAYPVLGLAQTAAAREQANSGPAPTLNERGGSMGGGGGSGSRHYQIRLIGMPRYRNVPSLTREVTVDGVQVWFYVVYLPTINKPLRAIVLGNDPKLGAHDTRRRYLNGIRQAVNKNLAGYQLYVRIGDHGYPRKITPDRSPPGSENFSVVNTASSQPGPEGTIVALAPAHVARLSWSWPREFDTTTLTFDPAITQSGTVTDDVAIAKAPARFTSGLQIEPESVTYYAADGSRLASYTYSGNNANSNLNEIIVLQHPAPETALSRAAERDPATPNPIFVLPDVTTLRTVKAEGPQRFRVDLQGVQPSPSCLLQGPSQRPQLLRADHQRPASRMFHTPLP
jgi:hypothetical protein